MLKAAFAEKLNPHVLSKFNATVGDPKFTTLWEGLALLVAFIQALAALVGVWRLIEGEVRQPELLADASKREGEVRRTQCDSARNCAGPSPPRVQADLLGTHSGGHKSGSRLLVENLRSETSS